MANLTGKWIVALTGASGIRYGLELLRVLAGHENVTSVQAMISEAGLRVLADEENIKLSPSNLNSSAIFGEDLPKLQFFSAKDIGAPCASGSSLCDGMVIAPCSMATLGAVANGVPQNLIHRAADVTIKENRRLILVPRETPLSTIHLENLLKLSKIGATILPAMPGFYHKPTTVNDIVNMQVMKILDSMGLENNLVARWKQESIHNK